jgi:hypothetical protein
MAVAPSSTIAGVGTTHRNVNYEAKLVHLPEEVSRMTILKRLNMPLGVHIAPNYTSETQINR